MIPRTRRVCQIVNDVADGPQPPLEMLQVCDILRDQALGAGAPFVDPLAEHRIADAPQFIGADRVHLTDCPPQVGGANG